MAGQAPSLFLISQPSTAAKAADLSRALKSHGIDCWTGSLAPDGQLASEAIERLRGAVGVVLLFDRAAAASREVDRHLLVARQEGKALIPVRLEVVDEGLLRQELLDAQWIDGNSPAAPAEIAARVYRADAGRHAGSGPAPMAVRATSVGSTILLGLSTVALLGILAILLFLAVRPPGADQVTALDTNETKARTEPAKKVVATNDNPPSRAPPKGSDPSAAPPAAPPPATSDEDADLPVSGTVWRHNGSTIALTSTGSTRTFSYLRPASGVPARPGDVVFTGTRTGQRYRGTAYLFSNQCGRIGYPVAGDVSPDQPQVVLYGQAPRRDRVSCEVIGYSPDRLVFDYLHR